LKAAREHRSISEIVNEAVCQALRAENGDLAGLEQGEGEQATSYEALLARLKADLRPSLPRGVPVEKLLEEFRHLPHVDPRQLRADVDSHLDPSL
jgi:hypothetical protein